MNTDEHIRKWRLILGQESQERFGQMSDEAGLSQEQLAEMVGLTSQHISHTEVASTKISLPALVKIANALHTSVDRLLSDSVHASKPHLLGDVQKVFSDCDPDEVYVMLEAANAIKKSIRVRKLKRME